MHFHKKVASTLMGTASLVFAMPVIAFAEDCRVTTRSGSKIVSCRVLVDGRTCKGSDCSEATILFIDNNETGDRYASKNGGGSFTQNNKPCLVGNGIEVCLVEISDPSSVAKLRQEFNDLNNRCRGGSGDNPRTQEACDKRDAVFKQLKARGITP